MAKITKNYVIYYLAFFVFFNFIYLLIKYKYIPFLHIFAKFFVLLKSKLLLRSTKPHLFCGSLYFRSTKPQLFCTTPHLFSPACYLFCTKLHLFSPAWYLFCPTWYLFCPKPDLFCTKPHKKATTPHLFCAKCRCKKSKDV